MVRLAGFLVVTLATAAMGAATIHRDLEYGKVDGVSLKLDAATPDGPGPFPVLILVHGGGWSGGDKATDFRFLYDSLNQAKFTWFSINYRLAPKYRWPACYDDVQTAILWVKQHASEYKGEANQIALIGYSAGGHLVFYSAVKATDQTRVQAIVGFAPPTDLELDLPQRGGLSPSLQNLLDRPHELTDESRKMLHDISSVNFVPPGLPPILIVHGDADKSVPYPGSINFLAKLKENRDSGELITIPGGPHRIDQWRKLDPTFIPRTIDWLNLHLGRGSATQPTTTSPVPP